MTTEKVYKKHTLEELQELYKDKVSIWDLYHAYHHRQLNRDAKRELYHKKKAKLIEQNKEVKEEIKTPSQPPASESDNKYPPIIKDTKTKKPKN
jgi:hypothetical protein